MTRNDQDTAVTDVGKPLPNQTANDCLVVIYRRDGDAGKCFRLEKTPVRIGRGTDNEIVLDDDGVSRRHARLERRGDALAVMDVGSTNGTLLNDQDLMQVAELRNGDRIKIGSMIFKYLRGSDIEAALHEEIYANAITDNLTGLFNRRHFEDEFAREFTRSRRHARPLGLLVIDIDHFKRVNDDYGHHVGDMALHAVADAIRRSLRAEDTAARFGGEEMAVLLPETSLAQVLIVAEKARAAVERETITFRGSTLRVTVSIGCAAVGPTDAEPSEFFARCDKLVYRAKEAGRNCIRG